MTSSSLRRAAGAALLALPVLVQAAPAQAPAPVSTPESATGSAPAAVQPKAMTAVVSALRELGVALEDSGNLARNLDRLKDFRFKPATAEALHESLGTDHLWTLEKRGSAYRLAFLPVRHTLESGASIAWSEFPIDIHVDQTGKRMRYEGAWPELGFEDAGTRAAMRDLELRGEQRIGAGRLWYGDVGIRIASATVASKKEGQQVAMLMEGLDFSSHTRERGALVDVSQKLGLKSVSIAGQAVTDVVMDYRVVNLDKKTLVALAETNRRLAVEGKAEEASLDELKRMMRLFGRSAAARGTKLVFDRIAATYGGHTASIRGSLGMKKGPEPDFKDLMKVLRRVDARFEVEVPVALVKAAMTTAARQQAAARQQGAASGAPGPDADAMAQTMTDVVVGKLVGGGYARLDGEVLRTRIEVKDGVIRMNGKKVELPKPPQQQPQQSGRPAPSMPARMIEGSCTMPDFPQEVVEKDGQLSLTLGAMISEQGAPAAVAVFAPSGYPDYDREAVAAMAGCRYVPALNGNAPVAQPIKLTITREPGAVRP